MTKNSMCRAKTEQTSVPPQPAGFSNSDAAVVFPEQESTRGFAHPTDTKRPERGVLGGALDWIAGIVGR